MLDINIEFTKGVLFIRLEGVLDNTNIDNIRDSIIKILKEGGIKYLVFNVHNLKVNDNVSFFDECEKIVKLNDGNMLICGLDSDLSLKNYKHVDNELIALRTLSSC